MQVLQKVAKFDHMENEWTFFILRTSLSDPEKVAKRNQGGYITENDENLVQMWPLSFPFKHIKMSTDPDPSWK